jgi:hypothetical protein
MYIRMDDSAGLGQPRSKPYRRPFDKGGEYIGPKDGEKLLMMLSGPSPFQNYIQPVLAVQGSRLPSDFLRVIGSAKEAPERLRGRFTREGGKMVGGTIDRAAGRIYLLETPGARGYSRVEFALHEAVHLLADPFMKIVSEEAFTRKYGRSCLRGEDDVGTFQRKYCMGLGEGATQVITEEIMAQQGIEKYYRERPYDKFTPTVRKLIKIFSLDQFARAYFWTGVASFTAAMEARWGGAWRNVANLTSAQRPDLALAEITKLEAAYVKRPVRRPAGDFPIPSRVRRMA